MRSNIDKVIFKFNNLYDKIKFIFDYVRDSNIFYKINSCNKEIQIKFLKIITNIKNKLIDLLAIYNDLSFIHKIEDKDVFYQILDLLVFINDYILDKSKIIKKKKRKKSKRKRKRNKKKKNGN